MGKKIAAEMGGGQASVFLMFRSIALRYGGLRLPQNCISRRKNDISRKKPPFFSVWYIMYLYNKRLLGVSQFARQNLQNGEADTVGFDRFLDEHRT